MNPLHEVCLEIIQELKKKRNKIRNQASFNSLKLRIVRKHKLDKIPKNIDIANAASKKDREKFKDILTIKPARTISGVAVVAVMGKPYKCPHNRPCIYCPGGVGSVFGNMPQSYTGKEPATRRAIRNKFDPYLQVMNRLEHYAAMNKPFDKVELIIMGGTFPSFPSKYQKKFIKSSFKAMNDFSDMFFKKKELDFEKFSKFFELDEDINDKKRVERIHKRLLKMKDKGKKGIEAEKEKNETANVRCVSLVLETRPDYAKLKHANKMLEMGCTKVEMGVQTIYDDILKKIGRGHSSDDIINSTKALKDLGFKVCYHVMPGLPGVDRKKDLFALQALFGYEELRPDMLKIYPCMVLKGTRLYNLWKKKKFKPITTMQAANLIADFKKIVPNWVRIQRVQRDVPTFMTEAGVDRTNLRQYVEKVMKKKKIKCKCIRCREAGHFLMNHKKVKVGKIEILVHHYLASDGNEFFISAEDVKNDILFGFCRLRFPNSYLRKEINDDTALVRELHVFSPAVAIGKRSKSSYQHRGIGKKLMGVAEETAKTYYKKKMVVISGVGAKEYFRKKLGYKKDGPYMSKKL